MSALDLALSESLCASASGVVGWFVGDDRGELVASSMPSSWSSAVLRRSLSRVIQILTCARSCGVDASDSELLLGTQRLWTARFPGGILCVLSAAAADRRAVRAAMQRLALELPRQLESLDPDGEEATVRHWRPPHR